MGGSQCMNEYYKITLINFSEEKIITEADEHVVSASTGYSLNC